MLNAAEVPHYLLEQRLLTARDIVGSGVTVQDASRRNVVFRVDVPDGPSYVLKHAIDEETRASLDTEARQYSRFDVEDAASALRPFLAQFRLYDAARHVLVLDAVEPPQTVTIYQARRGRPVRWLARQIGTALGALHRLAPRDDDVTRPPWIFFAHEPALDTFRRLAPGSLRLLPIVQGFPAFAEALEGFANEWRSSNLVHGDVKWDNWLVGPRGRSRRLGDVKLIDWELASAGDPTWDVGSAIASHVSWWLMSIPIAPDTPPERIPGLAERPLAEHRPALRDLWSAYARTAGLKGDQHNRALSRSMCAASLRLVQTAFEASQGQTHLPSISVCLLQVAHNMLAGGDILVDRLLGPDVWQ